MARHHLIATCSTALLLLLSACALQPVMPGMARDAVLAQMGTPTRELPLGGGATRLQYSLQPAGQQAWMVDLDSTGHVTQVRQVLVAPEFARIQAGSWTRADVEREFGPPASVDRVGNWPHPIMTYRWREVQDMFYWVYLDDEGVVRRTEQGVEYRLDTRD
jgi:hypothetical protein